MVSNNFVMKNLEKYSRENNKEIMSLDMHVSASDSKCWTYGITFTRNPENFICKSKKINNFDWVKNYYEMTAGQSNIDLFTQYLKDCGDKTIGSFYFENTHFVHLAGHLLDIRHLSLERRFHLHAYNTLFFPRSNYRKNSYINRV